MARTPTAPSERFRIAIVGTGFAGLGMAIQLMRAEIDDFVVLERAGDVGGTWRDNSYPGAACDVPSLLYSFSFAQNPDWTRSFSPQSEIHAYLRKVAAESGVLPKIRFDHEVTDGSWDDVEQIWRLQTPQGELLADVVIGAMGPLADPAIPDIKGLAEFEGTVFHSARWDHEFDLHGKRVAVIGTGASAIQFVPQIQPKVGRLLLFQRTPAWVMPRWDRNLTRLERAVYRRVPAVQQAVRSAIYWGRESWAIGFTRRPELLKLAQRNAERHLYRQIKDPELRAKLRPSYVMGCKRVLISTDFYPALAQPNADVITEGIEEITANGIRTRDGVEHEVDAIIFGTGFHVTDLPFADRVHGRDGVALSDAWADGMEAYLGTTVPGFPNLFLVIGPNTGLGHTSMVFMIESQLAYIVDALRWMDRSGNDVVEVRPEVTHRYNEALQRRMGRTIWSVGGCKSWYVDEHGRNTTLWPGFTFEFRRRTRHFRPEKYVAAARHRAAEQVAV